MTPEMRTVCLAPVRTEKGRVQVKLTRRRFVMVPLKFSLPGIALGFGLSQGVTFWMQWPTAVSPGAVMVAFGFAGAIGVFFGFYPARKAAALDPIDALRFE